MPLETDDEGKNGITRAPERLLILINVRVKLRQTVQTVRGNILRIIFSEVIERKGWQGKGERDTVKSMVKQDWLIGAR